MDAYIYRAALYCEDCASEIDAQIGQCGDSEHCVQGPYPNGGGEADSPQHCDTCGVFLENPLTHDGTRYVTEAIRDYDKQREQVPDAEPARGEHSFVIDEWRTFYADALA